MANIRKKRCKQYGCPNLHTNKNGYCDDCNRKWLAKHPEYQKEKAEREKERNRIPAHKRGYDARWHKFAKAYIQKHPICAICGQPAKVCDHKDIPADVLASTSPMVMLVGKPTDVDVRVVFSVLDHSCPMSTLMRSRPPKSLSFAYVTVLALRQSRWSTLIN